MTVVWIRAAIIRAVRTMAQTAVALIGTQAVGILEVDWLSVLSASLLAGVLSILTSIAGLPEVQLQDTLYALDNEADEEYMAQYDEIVDEEGDEE